MRHGIAQFRRQNVHFCFPWLLSLAAEIEEETSGIDAGLTMIDAAIAEANDMGQHRMDAESHRIRGETLFNRNPANAAAAEKAFLAAIAIKARSFELRAALALAKLYQSTDRADEAHAVLASTLEGFSPPPEFCEIEQAQTLLRMLNP